MTINADEMFERKTMYLRKILKAALPALLAVGLISCASTRDLPSAGTPLGDPLMGDWEGYRVTPGGSVLPLAVQLISYGENNYDATVLESFLQRDPERFVVPLRKEGDTFSTSADPGFRATVKNGVISGSAPRSNIASFTLRKIERLSPTLGAHPPAGATILFDGKDFSQWEHPDVSPGLLDFARLIGGNDRVAYAKASIVSAVAQDVLLLVGSDDGVKLWLNGISVHAHNISRSATPGDDTVRVRLAPGNNELLAKVNQGDGGWALCVRVADASGHTPADLSGAPDATGYLMRWQITGPYTAAGKNGAALFDAPFAPEIAGTQNITWTRVDPGVTALPIAWKLVDGAMEVAGGAGSLITKKKFTDCDLHIEFRSPFMPGSRGQARGNSGVYLQGRYEVQVLDSYGLTGADNECGGIYQVSPPRVNMCAPPGQWQTYDIRYRAPRFDVNGNKTASALVSVRHNGIIIHENLVIPGPTGSAIDNRPQDPGGLLLQDHGNPVQYRNIWLVEPVRADAR
jgi:hypothetical protein